MAVRTIIFRGKRIGNGEWVCGFIVKMFGTYHIIDKDDENTAYEVDPSTVGQYTGLKDKNGKRIFENGYMIIDKQTYKVLFDNGEYILKNIFNCDIIQLKNNPNIGVFVDEI